MRASAAAAAASALLLLGSATAKCSLRADTDVVVYSATGAGGVGEFSDKWTRAFFSWWSAANADLSAVFITDPAELAGVEVGCVLTDAKKFPRLKLYVQPGGSADNQSTSLGPGGRDNILNFAASPNGHYMGTCAGFYYGAGARLSVGKGQRRLTSFPCLRRLGLSVRWSSGLIWVPLRVLIPPTFPQARTGGRAPSFPWRGRRTFSPR